MRELDVIKGLLVKAQKKQNAVGLRMENELWTVQMVADYLHKSKGTIQSHYQGKPGFPRSVKIGNAQFWKPKEIFDYATKRTTH